MANRSIIVAIQIIYGCLNGAQCSRDRVQNPNLVKLIQCFPTPAHQRQIPGVLDTNLFTRSEPLPGILSTSS